MLICLKCFFYFAVEQIGYSEIVGIHLDYSTIIELDTKLRSADS